MIHGRQIQAYKDNQIRTLDPGRILLLLYQEAIDALTRAKTSLEAGDMAAKGKYILRAHDIISQFLVSLDFRVGGELARNLADLYRYMLDQILLANVNNDPEGLQRVVSLLSALQAGWDAAVASQRKRTAEGAA